MINEYRLGLIGSSENIFSTGHTELLGSHLTHEPPRSRDGERAANDGTGLKEQEHAAQDRAQDAGRSGRDSGGRRLRQLVVLEPEQDVLAHIRLELVHDHDQDGGHRERHQEITYRFYRNNVCVQHPVNYKYQSLNVSVPVEIDGKAVDATSAPIMFAINVGGCLIHEYSQVA